MTGRLPKHQDHDAAERRTSGLDARVSPGRTRRRGSLGRSRGADLDPRAVAGYLELMRGAAAIDPPGLDGNLPPDDAA